MKIALNEKMANDAIPVVNAIIDGVNTNLVIDSGANVSYLDSNQFKPNDHVVNTFVTYGIGGAIDSCSCMYTTRIGNFQTELEFALNDLSQSMNGYTQIYGVKISGLLGADFLKKYKCHINFEEMNLII